MGNTEDQINFDSAIEFEQEKMIEKKSPLVQQKMFETNNEDEKDNIESEEILLKTIPEEIFDIPVSSEHITIEGLDSDNDKEIILSSEIKNLEVIYEILQVNSTKEEVLVEYQEDFSNLDLINNLTNEILDLELIDIETVSVEDNNENQFIFDFTLPNKSQASNDAEKLDNEPDDLEVPIEAEDINEAMDFKFEIIEKSEQTESLNSGHKEDNSESKSL